MEVKQIEYSSEWWQNEKCSTDALKQPTLLVYNFRL